MASSMEALEELLPDINNFLRHVLKKENLSSLAEKKRQYYVERIDVFILPPDLPPRPDGHTNQSRLYLTMSTPSTELPVTEGVKEGDNFLAQQRALSRANATPANKETTVPVPAEEFIDIVDSTQEYSDDDLYEVPDGTEVKRLSSGSFSDGTSYESYDEEDAEVNPHEVVYENQMLGHDVLLPSVKGKTLTELNVKPDSLPIATFCGELSQRAKLSWPRRYCVISLQHLCVYKSERDNKPFLVVPLVGYDALYFEKNKRSHVIRLAQPARTTHWFCASTSDSAHAWVEHLNAASIDVEVTSDGVTEETSGGSLTTQMSVGTEQTTVSLSQSNLSSVSSEGSSGDGVVQAASDREKKAKRDESLADKKKFSLPNFLTFGKKKGDKVIKRLTLKDIDADTETTTAGQLNIRSEELLSSCSWQSLWCVVKAGSLECFREVGDDCPVLSLLLTGMTIDNAAPSTKRELALKLLQFNKEMLCLEAKDSLDHGRWLNALIKGMVAAPHLACVDDTNTDSVSTGRDSSVYSDVYEDFVKESSTVSHKTVEGASSDEEEQEAGDVYDDVELEPLTTVEGASSDEEEQEAGDVYDDVELEPLTTARSTSSDGAVSSDPPPLPKDPPPVDRLLRRKPSNSEDILAGARDGSLKHGGLNFEAEMTAKFSEIQSQYKLSLSGSDDGTTSSSGDARSSNDSGVSVSSRCDTGSSTVSVNVNNQGDVIKCHSGRAINQDREVLESAENPILVELRRGRLGGGSSLGKRQRQEEIERLRNKATLTRKNRQQVRGQKLAAHNSTERQSLEDELERLDTELEETESKLTKLQLLVQSKKDTSHNLKPSMKNKTQSSNSVTCSTKVSTTTSVGRKQNSRPPQRKQEAVSVINKCITSKVVGSASSTRKTSVTPLCKTDTGLSSQVARSECLAAQRGVTQRGEAQRGVAQRGVSQRGVAQRGVAQQGTTGSNGCRSNNTQNETKTSTVQQKLKLWESISDSSSTC